MPKSLKQIALIVTSGTLLSKLGGLGRQLAIAAAFGVGPAYDAFNYASIIPGFVFVMLGGINGPFHSAMVTVLSRKSQAESAEILTNLNTLIGALLAMTSVLLIIFADLLIHVVAPGLNPELHQIAVIQLQIMAPMTLLAGLIGLGFGSLNAANLFWIPSVSPAMSSVMITSSIFILWIQYGSNLNSSELALKGGIALAVGSLLGALFQWIIQLPLLIKNHLTKIQFSWKLNHPGVQEVWKVMWPATLASGMLQINVFTDLFFASGIAGAAAGLSYATLLIQTPLGLISNALLIPLLPTYSRLTASNDKKELTGRIRQGLMLSTASMVSLGAIFIALSNPIVHLIYQRGAFGVEAEKLVASLLIAYGIGMPFYLGRDLLVRIFYALGDSQIPFKVSVSGIGINIFLDWILIGGPSPWGYQMPFNFGAVGLVLATAGVNIFTCFILLEFLKKRLKNLPIMSWYYDMVKLICAGIISSLIALLVYRSIVLPNHAIGDLLNIIISSSSSLVVFGLIGNLMNIKEINEIILVFKHRINRL